MELRTLEYFLAVAREGNITNAARALRITQPTLSRQLASLEREFGQQLYTRNHQGIELTDQGIMLHRYAESIVGLARKAEADMRLPTNRVRGVVHIGAGETHLMGLLAHAMRAVRDKHPGVAFDVTDGATLELKDGLVKGRFDVMLECDLREHSNLNVLELPLADEWVALMRTDDPLAQRESVSPEDLAHRDLIVSHQAMRHGPLLDWFGGLRERVRVVAEYNLALNTRYMVQQGLGVSIVYRDLVQAAPRGASGLCSRPLRPAVVSRHGLVWRRVLPNRQTRVFLDEVRRLCEGIRADPDQVRAVLAGRPVV